MNYLKDKFGVARAYTNLANTHMLLQDYDKAIDFYEKRLTLSKEHQDLAAKGRTICSIGNCLQAMRQLDKSIEFYSSAMKVAEELGDHIGKAIVFGNLGTTYLFKGDCTNSLSCYRQEHELMVGLKNFKGRIKALDSLWLAYEQEESYENAMQTLEQMISLLDAARGYEAELQCVIMEKERLQHFFRVEKDISKGKNNSLLKRFKTTSIKQMFKKDSISSPKLERGTSSPKNPHTRSSYQGKSSKKVNSEEHRIRRHNSLTDAKDLAEIQEALGRYKNKSISTVYNSHPIQCHTDEHIQELIISPSTELMGLLYMTDSYPNSEQIISKFDQNSFEEDDIYASYGSKTNHYTHFCLVSAVLAKLDTNGDVVDNEGDLCKKGMAFLSEWNGWILCQQHIFDSSLFSISADAQPKESDMI
ncbi:Tetratricopeptide repeat protein 28 [Oopsacas minuta]|uniref:Tetratricopeptide repeat protein 28 n=1 Tax=Oopsacas minuta TaxID=111878 RepID=A0AAV7K7X9_9METZ|nr:Tetratricopeptide repeat protein 28 [Oopsacas minuta]